MAEAETWRYRGQTIDREQIAFLRQFIREHPGSSRWKLSGELCGALGWNQANGALRDVVCRGLLLMLERAGEIELPAVRWRIVGQRRTARPRPEAVLIDTTPLTMPLGALEPIEIQLVRRTADEPLFHSLMEQFHYLRYERPVGEHLKYLVWAGYPLGPRPVACLAWSSAPRHRPVGEHLKYLVWAGYPLGPRPGACLAWSSAPRHLASRDRFIGWNGEARRRNIRFLAYNTRFLILPWVTIPHLASHILGRMGRQISQDWKRSYGHPIYLLETFIDPERFRGTCYRAANWVVLGRTTGRGKADQSIGRTGRSKRCWRFHSIAGFTSY